MITEEEKTFFTLKFGTDVEGIMSAWELNEVKLTPQERKTLAELLDISNDELIAGKAHIQNTTIWNDENDIR